MFRKFHFTFLVLVLIQIGPGATALQAQSVSGAKELVITTQEKLQKLEEKLFYAELMHQMETIDNKVTYGTCRRQTDALNAARDEAETQLRIREFESCFNLKVTEHLQYYPELRRVGIRDYESLNRVYLQILHSKFNNDRDFNASKAVATLKQEIKDFKDGQDRVVAILVSVFKDVYVKQGGSTQWRMVSAGTPLLRSALVRTGDQGRARFEFVDYFHDTNSGPSAINVGSDTILQLSNFNIDREKHRKVGALEILKGAIRMFSEGWGGKAAFTVRTGTSLCGIRGTDIEIHYQPQDDQILYRLRKGEVQITTPYDLFLMKPGQEVSVTNGTASAIRPITTGGPS